MLSLHIQNKHATIFFFSFNSKHLLEAAFKTKTKTKQNISFRLILLPASLSSGSLSPSLPCYLFCIYPPSPPLPSYTVLISITWCFYFYFHLIYTKLPVFSNTMKLHKSTTCISSLLVGSLELKLCREHQL